MPFSNYAFAFSCRKIRYFNIHFRPCPYKRSTMSHVYLEEKVLHSPILRKTKHQISSSSNIFPSWVKVDKFQTTNADATRYFRHVPSVNKVNWQFALQTVWRKTFVRSKQKQITSESRLLHIVPMDVNVIVSGRFPKSFHWKVPIERKSNNGKSKIGELSYSDESGLKTSVNKKRSS